MRTVRICAQACAVVDAAFDVYDDLADRMPMLPDAASLRLWETNIYTQAIQIFTSVQRAWNCEPQVSYVYSAALPRLQDSRNASRCALATRCGALLNSSCVRECSLIYRGTACLHGARIIPLRLPYRASYHDAIPSPLCTENA